MSTMKYPHCQAAFINAIAEEGTKDEAVQYLQETWNERCFLAMRLAELEKEVARLRAPPDETLSDNPGCVFCMEAGTPVRPGEVCPKCGDRLPTKAMMDRLQTQATMDLMMKDLREDQWHRQAAVKNMKKAEQRVKELEGLLKEVVEDRDEANWSLGTDLVERIDAALTTAP